MTDQHNAETSTTGPPPATGIFKPRLLEVEESVDADEVFERARKLSSGKLLKEEVGHPAPNMVEGQRGVAIVTPGRLIMFDRCPEPDSMPEEQVAPICQVLPREGPLTITVISYTDIEALTADTDMTRTIPFRGFLNAWAYAGHNVVVFEGHPSAFESGVRDCDVLLVDSGMLPFIQFNWASVAARVMRPGGTIYLHDRETYTLSIIKDVGIGKTSSSQTESEYAELLLRFLMRSSSSTVQITSGEVLPDLADLLEIDVDWIAKLNEERDKLNTDTVIDILLQRAGWRWYLPFKRSGNLEALAVITDGIAKSWKFSVTLGKTPSGKRQLHIDR
ncbi:MAG TPA: hypothetical protein VJM12_10885 [Pyrinomonadaceae bacterium]|nr:hypothetical protein [Pyrinomonadaceae bacterium]